MPNRKPDSIPLTKLFPHNLFKIKNWILKLNATKTFFKNLLLCVFLAVLVDKKL